ncbi:unnamed protein product [Phaedon cochleariae]|uniref:Uncharacterized protein n=1 Tax=Phaedon cochleariae TaxID=80249 RepID=A0A9N9X512_PHACE|nr:unnamed protein product [Phaedon cochleariae]
MLIIAVTCCASVTLVMSLILCICWGKKTPKDEWQGLDGMVTQKNPDENVNHLPSAASCDGDSTNASGDSNDKRNVVTNTRRSLPDIPAEQVAAINWDPTGDNSSEHYATHSSISQADDTFSPYERVKYDKIDSKQEHPYARLQPTTSRQAAVEEEGGGSEERINLLRADVTVSTVDLPPTRSRRSSAHSGGGLDIPAASAVAGAVAASPDLPYMTPPPTYARIPVPPQPPPVTVEAEVNAPPALLAAAPLDDRGDSANEPPEVHGPPGANLGSPKPEKRQANSPLPPPPTTATNFDFHAVKNLDDLYAKNKNIVCVKCGCIYHLSCATRNKLECTKICDTRIICSNCQADIQGQEPSTSETCEKLILEINLLKIILKEKDDKINLLIENNQLLKRNNILLEEKLTSQQKIEDTNKNLSTTTVQKKKSFNEVLKKNSQVIRNVSLPGPADELKQNQNKINNDSLEDKQKEIMNGLIYADKEDLTNGKTSATGGAIVTTVVSVNAASDPNYEELRHRPSDASDCSAYAKIRDLDDGYSVVKKRQSGGKRLSIAGDGNLATQQTI